MSEIRAREALICAGVRGVAGLLLALAVTACAGPSETPGPTPRIFLTDLPHQDQPSIPVILSDYTGLVMAIDPQSTPSSDEHTPALLTDPTDPNAFVVTWLGGLCDREIDLEVRTEPGGIGLHLGVQGTGNCPAAGVSRGVRIVTSSPIQLSSIRLTGRG